MNKTYELLKKVEEAGEFFAKQAGLTFDGVMSDSFTHIACFSEDGETCFSVVFPFSDSRMHYFSVLSKIKEEYTCQIKKEDIN